MVSFDTLENETANVCGYFLLCRSYFSYDEIYTWIILYVCVFLLLSRYGIRNCMQ